MLDLAMYREEGGLLAQHAWPGGYLIEWITSDGDSLCADCATRAEAEIGAEVAPFTHEAGSDGYTCDDCGEEKS